MTDTYEYGAYGEVLRATGATENPYLYRGESWDSELGLQYLRARYYEPETGRFLSTDPFEGMVESPVSRHRYLYGNANPVVFEDPSGEMSISRYSAARVIDSILEDFLLAGISFSPAQLIMSEFANIREDSIQWDGLQISFDATFGYRSRLLGFTGFGVDIYAAQSSNYGGNKRNVVLLTLHSNFGKVYLQSPRATLGSFTVQSPASMALSNKTLSGGFLAIGGSIFAGHDRPGTRFYRYGAGYSRQLLSLGFARGNAHGFGVSYGRGVNLFEFQAGLSIPLWESDLLENPTTSND
ncbi:Wall-associated protein precursor [Geitlerinema sp. FC II]|nr:Wall-associated protein precursor [Geitlerinema sp. FC II]